MRLAKRYWLGLIAALSLATGCVSVLPEPEVAQALYKIEGDMSVAGLAQHINIREPEAARLMAGQAMVSEGADGGLRLLSKVEWAGPATRQMQIAIIDSFAPDGAGAALLPEIGVIAPFELASQIRILRLQGNEAVCAMSVTVLDARVRQPIKIQQISHRQPVAGNKAADAAIAMKAVAGQCARSVAEIVVSAVPPVSE